MKLTWAKLTTINSTSFYFSHGVYTMIEILSSLSLLPLYLSAQERERLAANLQHVQG